MPGAPAPSPASGGAADNVYDVIKDFGAAGDGVTDDTDAIKTAWDTACQDAGEGVVLAAAGHSFLLHTTTFSGPCQGSVALQIDGTIVAPSDPATWPANSKRNWLVFYRADGVSLRGSGLIDGKGQKWWDLPCKPHMGGNTHGPCDSPVALRFFLSNNVTVQGLKVHNSPEFHFRFDSCRGVRVDGLSISSPALSPNTDGIHVENTQDVLRHQHHALRGRAAAGLLRRGRRRHPVLLERLRQRRHAHRAARRLPHGGRAQERRGQHQLEMLLIED